LFTRARLSLFFFPSVERSLRDDGSPGGDAPKSPTPLDSVCVDAWDYGEAAQQQTDSIDVALDGVLVWLFAMLPDFRRTDRRPRESKDDRVPTFLPSGADAAID
jgi:hypothetical protein